MPSYVKLEIWKRIFYENIFAVILSVRDSMVLFIFENCFWSRCRLVFFFGLAYGSVLVFAVHYWSMPTIEYKCQHCGHAFNRTILKGDEPGSEPCPKCHHEKVKPSMQSPGLFEGIANFSTLGKDTN
jgi:putative FmdB family regulatory protein